MKKIVLAIVAVFALLLAIIKFNANGFNLQKPGADEKTNESTSESTQPVVEEIPIPGMNAKDLVANIRVGWNAGNDMECCDGRAYEDITQKGKDKVNYYETCWGSAVLTEEVVESVKNAGFNAIRVPITFRNHINKNGVIDFEWMDRIKEIVNWVVNRDMYCIINVHHDTGNNGWLMAEQSNYDANHERFARIWIQIADYFDSYDEHLIFEGLNELLNDEKQWEKADSEAYEVLNQYNQLFVDTVRSSNGFNKYRCLVVNTYAANTSKTTIDAFKLPNDTVNNRLIVSGHNYEGAGQFADALVRLNEKFVSKGVPVIIGEMGMTRKSGREDYVKSVFASAKEYGIKCFWWDDMTKASSAEDVSNYALVNRKTGVWVFPELIQIIMDSTN